MEQKKIHRGFTLLEALIALVVLSVGMLGIAALYVDSVSRGRTALSRTKAVVLAADMADRIRANSIAGAAYAGAAADNDCSDGAAAGAKLCSPAEMAAHDLMLWQAILSDPRIGVPGGVGTVTFDPASNPDTYTVTVSWVEVGEQDPVSYSLRIQT